MTYLQSIRSLILLSLAILFANSAFSQSRIILEGPYQGNNLYIQNPFAADDVGFCCRSVSVNGNYGLAETESSAFEIKLDALGLQIGEQIKIIITHDDDCKPKILNPRHGPKSPFDILSMGIDEENVLSWRIKRISPQEEIDFIVEHFRWNKWVDIGEVPEPDTVGGSTYSFSITDLHSGENKYRVKHIDKSRRPRYSSSVKVTSHLRKVTFNYDREKKTIFFTGSTLYEIYDAHGNIIKKGGGSSVNCSDLEPGTYYLNYDKEMSKFLVKKPKKVKKRREKKNL